MGIELCSNFDMYYFSQVTFYQQLQNLSIINQEFCNWNCCG